MGRRHKAAAVMADAHASRAALGSPAPGGSAAGRVGGLLDSSSSFSLGFAAGSATILVLILFASVLQRRRRRAWETRASSGRVVATSRCAADEADLEAQAAPGASEAERNARVVGEHYWRGQVEDLKEGVAGADEVAARRSAGLLTDREREQVSQLRGRLQQADATAGLAGGQRWYEDSELLRFVRARKTLADSESLFCDAMRCRREYANQWGSDTSATGSFGPEQAGYLASRAAGAPTPDWWSFLQDTISLRTYGCDSEGLPILYHGPGHDDLQGLQREVGIESLQRYGVLLNDHFLDAARAANKRPGNREVVHAGYVIIDLDGLAFRHRGEAKVFNMISAVVKILHPERMRRCFIVRAPRVFAVVYRLIRSVVDPRTVEKITILAHGDSLEPLVDELGAGNVPDFLGGKNTSLRQPCGDLVRPGAFEEHRKLLANNRP